MPFAEAHPQPMISPKGPSLIKKKPPQARGGQKIPRMGDLRHATSPQASKLFDARTDHTQLLRALSGACDIECSLVPAKKRTSDGTQIRSSAIGQVPPDVSCSALHALYPLAGSPAEKGRRAQIRSKALGR